MKAKGLLKNQLVIPIVALILLVLFNVIYDIVTGQISSGGFFTITAKTNNLGYTVLSGNLISILDWGSEIALLAIGMTLVTAATGGQDISVGATVAIAGSVIIRCLRGELGIVQVTEFVMPIAVAFIIGMLVAMLCGAFNGALVAVFKIPPMVATLILYTAGRSIAAMINHNENIDIKVQEFGVIGGNIPGVPIPTSIIITVIFAIIMFLILKFTTLGLYTQTVGINEKSARLNGINPTFIKILSFVILGVCVAVVALIRVSRTNTINYSVICKDYEMDAILAVALGGNALSGGKFNLWASILGAYIIQILTTTLFRCHVDSAAISAFKAIVVIILVVLSAPPVVAKLSQVGAKKKAKGV